MTVPDRLPIDEAFLELLRRGTGRPVGDADLPGEFDPTKSFCVVHPIDGGDFFGPPLWAPEQCATFVYQVRSVGLIRRQAQWQADRVRRTVLGRDQGAFQVAFDNPDGWAIQDRLADGAPGGVVREGTSPNLVFSVTERFGLRVVPA